MYVPVGITEEEYRTQDLAIRKDLLELRRLEVAAAQKGRLWSALGTVAAIGIPIVTFLGLSAYFKVGKK